MSNKLILSPAPHVSSGESIEKIMYYVVIALLPALGWSVYVFGVSAFIVILACTISAVVSEFVLQKLCKTRVSACDGSAIITGLLLAMNLPSGAPIWLCILGGFVSISLGKFVFGGLGNNIFNPALVGRAFLLISFPVEMTKWPTPFVDATTSATPLGVLSVQGVNNAVTEFPLMDLFLGNIGGSLGETCALAIIAGGMFLLINKYADWRIPVSYLGTVFILGGLFWLINPTKYPDPFFQILSGGLMLGAFFMATDMVTSPITPFGTWIFGIGAGIILVIIRLYGGLPEGVMYSILLMNSVTPLINRYTRPKFFGEVKK